MDRLVHIGMVAKWKMGRGQTAWAALLGLALSAGVGCSHSRPTPPAVTGAPETVALVKNLQKVNTDYPAVVCGTFVYETHQPRRAKWADWVYHGGSEVVADAILKGKSADSVLIHRYERKPQDRGWIESETWSEDGTPVSPDSPMLMYYPRDQEMTAGLWHVTHFGMLPLIGGKVSQRQEIYRGEQCTVIRSEWPSGVYEETYLSEKDGWLPLRIVVRRPPPSTRPTMPTHDLTGQIERETGTWPFKHREVTTWRIPLAAIQEMDLNYDEIDADTTIQKWIKRPDGSWLITEATTVWPFLRRTTQYRAENLK